MDEKINKLREEAEKILKQSISQKDDIPLIEFNRIIHDLKVYQIELEVQNEELRNTQKLLEDSRNQYAQLYNDAPAGYVTLDENSIVLQANQTFANMINKDMRQIINFSFSEFIEYEDSNIFNSRFNAFFKKPEGKNMELKLYKKNGKSFYTRISGKLIYKDAIQNLELKQAKLFLIITDISKEKAIEHELQENENNFRTIANSGQALIWTSDTDKLCNYFNDVWLNFTGRTIEQEMGNGWAEGVHPDDFDKCLSIYVNAFDKREKFSMDYRLKRHDGEYRWLQDDGCPRYSANGEFKGYIGFCLDITELKQVQHSLHLSQDMLLESGRIGKLGGWEIEIKTMQLKWSEETYRIHEVSLDKKPLLEEGINFYAPEARPLIKEALNLALEKGIPFDLELPFITAQNNHLWVRVIGKTDIVDKEVSRIYGVFQDITVQKLAELELKNKELQNRKLSDELESILDHIPGLVFYKDNKNNFIRVNKYVAEAYNKNKNELENTNLADLYPASVAEKYYQDDLSVINSGIAKLNIEEEWDTAEGLKWVSTSKIPFKNANEEIIGIIGISMDITNRRQADEKIRKLSQAVEQSPVSVVITNIDGNIEYVNPKFVSITGYTSEEVLGNNPRVLKSGEQSGDFYKELWGNITNGKVWKGEFRNKKKNGDFYWESASISPIKTDEGIVTHFIAVKEDITDRKLAEEEIKLKNEELQLLNATKDKFFSIIAHDLKSPFNSIIGFSEALVEQVKNADYNGIRKYAGIINISSYRAMDLLMNLMEWAQSQTGRMEFNPESFKINDIINETIILFEEIASQKLITIKAELPDNYTVSADKAMIGTILRNLISNAVKFTKQGGELYISTTLSKQKVIISVRDNGVGIPSENIEKLFRIDESYSTQGTNKEIGTGLGLILCKEFIDKHNEKIWVESEINIGSCFYFTLPHYTEDDAKKILHNELTSVKNSKELRGLKILIAEDDEISLIFISTIIKKISKEILKTRNGRETVETCRNNPDIDLILLDLKMPDINGYEACRQIRQFNKDVIIIAQSAFGLTGDREKAIEAGCNDYVPKPIKKILLLEKIESYFK